MKTSIHKPIQAAVSVVIGIVMIIALVYPSFVDKALLMEAKYPDFWKLMENDVYLEKMSIPLEASGLNNEAIPNIFDEYELISGDVSGVEFSKNGSGTVVLNGTAIDKSWPNLVSGWIYLEPGRYYISTVKLHGDILLYLEGLDEDGYEVIANNLGSAVFTVDEAEASRGYRLVVYLKEGRDYDNLEITPVLFKLDDSTFGEVQDDVVNAGIFHMSHEEWDLLSAKEKNICMNRIRFNYPEYVWTSVIFDDGYGIQGIDGKLINGEINMFGVVVNEQ